METDAEAAAERRSAYVGATVLAIITTGVMVAAVVENPRKFQFYFPPPDIGAAWLVAVATVCSAVALAGVMRLLSARPASIGQWLRRYSAGVVLLTPAALTLTGRFEAGWDIDDCGTLVDRGSGLAEIAADFQRDCDACRRRLKTDPFWTGES